MAGELFSPVAHTRPLRRIALDVETTGLQRYDRIVTLGAVRLEGNDFLGKALYLVFDPRTDSHPDALDVHGWDDWTTRFQDLFVDLAPAVRNWLIWADEIICHNAEFDMHYVEREIRKSSLDPLARSPICTLQEARSRWPESPAPLDACLRRFGLARVGNRHGALEDAILAAALFLCMQGQTPRMPRMDRIPGPTNLVQPPERPIGQLPRRTTKKAGQSPTLLRMKGGQARSNIL